MSEKDLRRDGRGNLILCGSSAYEKKFYFNPDFAKVPKSIQEELQVICVLFTEEVGGVFTIGFAPEGDVVLTTESEEDDIYYDEVSSGLLIGEIRRTRAELLEQLSFYYRLVILGESPEALLKELGESE
ncbi:MAG: DUF6145 family protein [Lachnospiraceae bacterium]|nr:DUF6145 family protein [Lachnospiraceae bacterium]